MNAEMALADPLALVAAPWFGRGWEHRQALIAGVWSFFICAVYWAATLWFAPEVTPGPVEFVGTATSLWSVWITQKRNVLALPIGIVSVGLMGWFFLGIGLIGQMLLHWIYYIPVQFWAWREWTRGGDNGTELIVTRLTSRMRLLVVVALGSFTWVFGWLLESGWETALYTYWDASIVAASVVAMVLLSKKKVESWWLWIGPVNIFAIGLYLATGAYMFAALYMLFLMMAVVGLARWNRAVGST